MGFYKAREIRSSGERKLRFGRIIKENAISENSFLDGWIGALRITALIVEIIAGLVATKFAPGLLPLIAIAGGSIHQTIDTYQYIRQPKRDLKTNLMFGFATMINILPIGFTGRKMLKQSRHVLKIRDASNKSGWSYIVRGQSRWGDTLFARLDRGLGLGTNAKRVSVALQNNLISNKTIGRNIMSPSLSKLDQSIRKQFSATGKSGWNRYKLGGWGYSKRYKITPSTLTFTNKDTTQIRNAAMQIAKGKSTEKALDMLRLKLSYSARNALDIGRFTRGWFRWKYGSFVKFKTMKSLYKRKIVWRDPYIQKQFLQHKLLPLAEIAKERLTRGKSQSALHRFFRWFGTSAGHRWTQRAQLLDETDFAREILRKPQNILLHGDGIIYGKSKGVEKIWYPLGQKFAKGKYKFLIRNRHLVQKIHRGKGGLRGIAKQIRDISRKKMPAIEKILALPIQKRLTAQYKFILKGLHANGVVMKSTRFLMGWRVLSTYSFGAQVQMYFNPVNTMASTPGSFNYGGKPTLNITLSHLHLTALKTTDRPGKIYLKGGSGFAPIALTPGGRRSNMVLMGKALEMLSVTMPLTPLRNLLSVLNNLKRVSQRIAQGTYSYTWKKGFINTLERMWVNRVTRIIGQSAGNLISNEMGMHASRILKTVGQGFQRSKTETVIIKGQKKKLMRTVFAPSQGFNTRKLIRAGGLDTIRSASMKRLRRGSSVKMRQRNIRYGVNIRRVPGLFLN